MRRLFMTIVATLAVAGCGSGSSGIEGTGCTPVASYRCEGNVLYGCHFDSASSGQWWVLVEDCGASPTSGCHCGSTSAGPMCLTADNQGPCGGT